MKIPGANPARGVQSLGRRGVYAPQRVAQAEARAAAFEGMALRSMGATVHDIGVMVGQIEDQKAVHEYNVEMLKAQAEAERAMGVISQPLFATDTPGAESLQFDRTITVPAPEGGTQTVERTEVPTYEVGGEWLTGRMASIRDSALANIKDGRGKEKFAAEWAKIEARTSTKAAGSFQQQRRNDLRGGYQVQLDGYIKRGDEDGARAASFQAFAARTISAEELAASLENIGSAIDTQLFSDSLATADDPGELEVLMDMTEAGYVRDADGTVRPARLGEEELWTLRQRANTKINQYESQRGERHERGGQVLASDFIKGGLTLSEVRVAVDQDQISATQALNFESRLRQRQKEGPAGLKSDPVALAHFRTEISNIGWTEGGESSMEVNRGRVAESLYMARNGITPDGAAVSPTIRLNGSDYQTLVRELDAQHKRVLSDPRIKQATDMIRAVTQVVPGMDLGLDGNAHKLRAFSAGQQALNAYVDRYGAEGDPVAWAKANAQMFDPEAYKVDDLRSFNDKRGAELHPFLTEEARTRLSARTENKMTQSEWPITQEDYLGAISRGMRKGAITQSEAQILYDQLLGLDQPVTPQALGAVQ